MTSPAGSDDPRGPGAEALVAEAAARLRSVLAQLASRLRPFPAFMNMTSLQAVELEPPPGAAGDKGCVVVLPGGEICSLELRVTPVAEGVEEIDSAEELEELELAPEDYITYASQAIRLLYLELRRREATPPG